MQNLLSHTMKFDNNQIYIDTLNTELIDYVLTDDKKPITDTSDALKLKLPQKQFIKKYKPLKNSLLVKFLLIKHYKFRQFYSNSKFFLSKLFDKKTNLYKRYASKKIS